MASSSRRVSDPPGAEELRPTGGAIAVGKEKRETHIPSLTVPTYQRRGLGKALMTEGLRRSQRMGATTALVSGHSPAANALNRLVMGSEYELYEPWVKEWLR